MAMGRVYVAGLCLLAAGFLTGCNLQPTTTTEIQQSTGQIGGRAMGGSQPIINSTVQLYTVGAAADGSAASPLGSPAITDTNGNFKFTVAYTCPATTTLVYITATGGNPGTGVNNSAITLMAVLGQCGTLSSSTNIVLNELTTVAAVYALAPFMTSSTTVGSSYIDSLSLASGFSLASYYANYATGSSPGTNVPSNATVPSTQINTIADALAACVNSNGPPTSSNCNMVFQATKTSTTTPSDIVSATLNLALGTATGSVSSLYGLVSASSPYQPYDSPAPANWNVALTFSNTSPLLATGDSRTVTQPTTPTSICMTLSAQFTSAAVDVASPTTSDDTSRIQGDLISCANSNQAVVLNVNGSNNAFLAGALTIYTGESLIVSSGVTLYANDSAYSSSQFIYSSSSNTGIYGPGTIDGRANKTTSTNTPRLVQFNGASNVIVYNVTLQNAAHPNLYIQGGSGATVWDVTILTSPTQANADGIDIDSITNVTVNNSLITAGDDGVAVKDNNSNTSNITIENTRIYGTHGLSIGSISSNTMSNVLFQNDYVYGQTQSGSPFGSGVVSTDNNGINIKTNFSTLSVSQVAYLNTCMTQVKHLIQYYTDYCTVEGSTCPTAGTPTLNDIVINGLKSTSSASGAYSNLYGYSSGNPIVAYFGNVNLDKTTMDTSSSQLPQNVTYYLNNSNFTPTGTNVISGGSFSINGSVPSCAF